MARILHNGEWYQQVAPASLYETEFERIVLQNGGLLFPEYSLVPFKPLLFSDDGSAKPDLALVNKECREWWLVEVEMVQHSLDNHVLPQIRILSRCECGPETATELISNCPEIPAEKIREMVKGSPPGVLVLANSAAPDWIQPLRKYDAELGIVEVYRSDLNRFVLRANGFSPTPPAAAESLCIPDPNLFGFLRIEAPAALDIPTKGTLAVSFSGGVSYWERIESKEHIWLAPQGPNPLDEKKRYRLMRTKNGEFRLWEI